MVSAWWASGLSAPTLIAETTKRRTMSRAGSTSESGTGVADGADAQLVARDRALGLRARERGAIAGEGRVGVARGVDLGSRLAVAGQDLDLAGDPRREEVRLAVGAEPGEAGIRQARLTAGGRFRDGQRGGAAADLAVGEVGQRRAPGPGGGGREAARDDRRDRDRRRRPASRRCTTRRR